MCAATRVRFLWLYHTVARFTCCAVHLIVFLHSKSIEIALTVLTARVNAVLRNSREGGKGLEIYQVHVHAQHVQEC